jgi:formylglycine-generating enzyme required for sulfatase activity
MCVKNAKGGPIGVGRKLCNARGFFDMHGNLYEWCLDWYVEVPFRVIRGQLEQRRGELPDGVPQHERTARTTNVFRLALRPSGVPSPAKQGQKNKAEPAGEDTEEASTEQQPEMP